MINAAEARKRTEENLEKGLTKELQKVSKLINEAIELGISRVCIDGTLGIETTNQLKKIGYRVETAGRYNESGAIITW